jgi:ribose transport system permease protein
MMNAKENMKNLLAKNGSITLFLCLALIIIISIGSNIFWSRDNLNSLQTSIAPTAIVAFGMCMLLICGVFDLSVGSIMAFSGMIAARLFVLPIPVPVIILIGLMSGAFVGLINGLLVGTLKINPLIATIGTMGSVQGVTQLIFAAQSKGQAEYAYVLKLPEAFIRLGTDKFIGLYYMFWVMLVLLAAVTIFLRYAPAGRKMYLTGDNIEAAKLMGFNTSRIILLTYVFTGFLCAVAGLLSVARFEQANRYLGEGMNLLAIISCILGGASFIGGRGSALGTLGGVVCMSLITNMFNLFEVKSSWQSIVVGFILIAVVTIDGYLILRKQRELGKV